jgi:hypothetical protein
MSLRNTPPDQLNYKEIVDMIQLKIPDINTEVRRRYVRYVSTYCLGTYGEGIRWQDWLSAVNVAMATELEPPFCELKKIVILKDVYNEYIRPYVGQFKTKGDAMAEAYMICQQLCKDWEIPEDQIQSGLNFDDIWEKDRTWDALELQKN